MSKSTKRLTEVQKAFVVRRLAAYDAPQEAADALRDWYGVNITPQAVEYYHPWKWAGRRLAAKWVDLFTEERAKFDRDLERHLLITNKAWRLRKLEKATIAFENSGNYLGMAKMLEQAAKECGDFFTNRRLVTGKDGGPVQYADVSGMTLDEIEAELRLLGVDPEKIGKPMPGPKSH